jgi:hypothetical protein
MATTRPGRTRESAGVRADAEYRENLTQIDLVLKRHEDLLAMTFRRIADLQAEVDALRGRLKPQTGAAVRKG